MHLARHIIIFPSEIMASQATALVLAYSSRHFIFFCGAGLKSNHKLLVTYKSFMSLFYQWASLAWRVGIAADRIHRLVRLLMLCTTQQSYNTMKASF